MVQGNNLEDRFIILWRRNAYRESLDVAKTVYAKLYDMYTESWRSYHNLEHITASLRYFDACKSHANFADAIETAIWFHDCIYVIGADNNESQSRDWFVDQTKGYIVPAVIERVDELIMDTRHQTVPDTDDGKLIADIDLTSFGLPWDQYMQDSLAVQSEYPNISNGCSVQSKIFFLENLLDDGQIYYSDYYLAHFEEKAQRNVRKHLQLLKGVTDPQ